MNTDTIKELAAAMQETLIDWRRELHKIPECGLDLPKTAEFVKQRLSEMGIEYTTYSNHSGITAVIGSSGKVIGIRADMDALYIDEQNSLEYKSRHDGCMHACGHDAHTAMLLGAAKIFKEHEAELKGRVKLIFQPAEEIPPGGAKVMVEDGVLKNPDVDAVISIHMTRMTKGAHNGQFVYKYGGFMAADDVIKLKITGNGGHASEPENCDDTILAACYCVTALQQVVSRCVSPNKSAVVSITDFHGGTGTDNVLPGEVNIIGTIRNTDRKTRETVLKRVRTVVENTAAAMGVSCDLQLIPDYPVLHNDKEITKLVENSIIQLYGEKEVLVLDESSMGGDDFAFFSNEVPGCYFTLEANNPSDDGNLYPAHHPRFDIDDSVLYKGTAAFIQTAVNFFEM